MSATFDPIDADLARHFDREDAEDRDAEIYASLVATVLAERVAALRKQLAQLDSNVGQVLQDVNDAGEYHDRIDALIRRAAAPGSHAELGMRFAGLVDGLLINAAREGLDDAVHARMRANRAEVEACREPEEAC